MEKIQYSKLLQTRKQPIASQEAMTQWFSKLTAANRNKLAILHEAQDGKCFYCSHDTVLVQPSEKYKKRDRATIDHIVPQLFGGTHSLKNMVMACSRCNNFRGTMDHEVFKHLIKTGTLQQYQKQIRTAKKVRDNQRRLARIVELAVVFTIFEKYSKETT